MAIAMTGVALGALASAGAASARPIAPAQGGDAGRVSILEVQGLIDPVLADFIERSIEDADDAGAVAVVLQLDSSGAVVDDDRLAELARTIADAEITVGVWVGPSGSQATGGAAQLAAVADEVGVASGARLGRTGTLVVPRDLVSDAFLVAEARLRSSTVGEEEAEELGLVTDGYAPILGEFLLDLPGFQFREVEVDGRTEREPLTQPVFSALPVQDQLFHTVASPAVAYLLFVIGLSLIVFELYTAGVGVAGLVGAGCFLLSCYGLAILPTRPWALGLLVLSTIGFAIDVQTGVPRVWSGIAVVALVVGSFSLYDGLDLSWITLFVGIVGTSLAMVGGMPAMVRTRFSTPTIGREWMVGEEGEAVTNVSPDGVVRVRGALWRARTNRATPIGLHDPVRVVEVEGLLLEVEPIEGGAADYREKRRQRGADGGTEGADDGVVLVDGEPLDD